MLGKFSLTKQAEVIDKTTQYRIWTSENFSLYKANTALQNCSNLWSSVPSKESDSVSLQGDSFVDDKLLFREDRPDKPAVHHLLNNYEASVGVSQLAEQGTAMSLWEFPCCCKSLCYLWYLKLDLIWL
jgi:general transcription factor 3C polypeptide 1